MPTLDERLEIFIASNFYNVSFMVNRGLAQGLGPHRNLPACLLASILWQASCQHSPFGGDGARSFYTGVFI